MTSVAALPDARLHVVFVDGTNGEVHLKSFLNSPTINGTVFEALRDLAIFAQAQVILAAVQWPNGADLAPIPCTMLSASMGSGSWIDCWSFHP
jgi:hypothetical protein